jgi:hypothetical protein
LEQQWEAPNCGGKKFKGICGRILQPSHTLTYTWSFSPEDQGKPTGTGKMIDINSLRIHGQPIAMDAVYKVVTIEFLAIYGGDNFSEFTESSMRMKNLAINDIQALQAYLSRFTSESRLMPPSPRIGCVLKDTGQDCGIPVL